MGKRSRKRGGSPSPREDRLAAATAPAPARVGTPSRRARLDEAPKPAWHPVPITEFAILVGLVLLVIGFVGGGDSATWLILGFGVTSLAAGELAFREHFAGYRSHSSLLAGLTAVALGVLLVVAGVPQIGVFAAGIAVLVGSFYWYREAFKRRAGGLGFRA